MNERIRELLKQAELPLLDVDGNCKYGDTYFSKEKFAELIVREVFSVIEDERYEIYDPVVQKVKQHFGVEE